MASTDDLLREGAARLLARASETRSLDAASILPRLRTTLEKYLLRDKPASSPSAVSQFLDALHADDLVLVAACERGDDAAWSDLMERYRAAVLSAARSVSAHESDAEELAQSVWAELYGLRERGDGRPAGKLAYYSGCGSLGGWLHAVVRQMGVDHHRKSARLVQTEDAAEFDRLASDNSHGEQGVFHAAASLDPERSLAERETAQIVRKALARAIDELAAEDRLLIKLYYFDGLRLREAGAVLGVHEATASRRVARLHTELRRRVEAFLVAEHHWPREEMRHSLAGVAAHLDSVDLRQVFVVETASGENRDKGG